MTHISNRISQFGSNIAGVLTLNTHSPKGVGVCRTHGLRLLPGPLMYNHEILDPPKRRLATNTYLPLENSRSAFLLCCCPGLLWNSLPVYVKTIEILQIFKRRTKTFLFIQAFFVTSFLFIFGSSLLFILYCNSAIERMEMALFKFIIIIIIIIIVIIIIIIIIIIVIIIIF